MFFALLSLTASKDFCFRPSNDFPWCPNNDTTYIISTVEELRAKINEDDEKINLAISNNRQYPITLDDDFQFKKPVKVYGVNKDSHFIFDCQNDQTIEQSITVENITIQVKNNGRTPTFQQLSLANVGFDVVEDLVFKAASLTSDIASLQNTISVAAKDVVLSFKNIGDKMKKVSLSMYSSTSTINFVDLTRNSVFHANEGSVTFRYENELKPQLEITRTEDAKYINAYMTVDNIKVDVESDSFLQYITLDPTVKNGGVINFHENTGCLSNNRDFTMEDGTASFKDNSYTYNLLLLKDHSSKLIFNKSVAFNTISITRHVLTVINDQNSMISCRVLTASLDSQINADLDLTLTGNKLNLGEGADIRTSHVTVSHFDKISTPSNTVKIQKLEQENFNVSIPISFEKSGSLQVDTFLMKKAEITLTHIPMPDESKDDWDKLIGKEITLLSTTSASSSIVCSDVDISIEDSSDPWSSMSLFTKERIKFEKVCTPTKVSFKLIENPSNVYKKFIFRDQYEKPYGDLTVINTSTKWENYVSKYTEGFEIMLHNSDPITFNINSFQFSQKVQLRFTKSPYTGAESLPTICIKSDGISDVVDSLYFKDVCVYFKTDKQIPEIDTNSLTILGNTKINSTSYSVLSKQVTVQDKFISDFKLTDGMKLTVIPSDQRFNVYFTNSGWTFNGASLGSVDLKANVELTIYTDCPFINFDMKNETTEPHTLTLIHYGTPSITFNKNFEKMSGMPPIVIKTDDTQVRINTGASYLPITIVQPAKITFQSTTYPEKLTTSLPAQKLFSGNSVSLSLDESAIDKIEIPSFYLRDPPDGSGMSSITSSDKIKFEEVRSLIDLRVNMTKIDADKIVIDGTDRVSITDSSFKQLRIQGELSYKEFPKIDLTNVKNLESIYVDIEQPGAQSIPSFSRPMITCTDGSVNLIDLQKNVTLSKSTFYIGTQPMYVSTTAKSDIIYIILSPAPYTPTSATATPTVYTATSPNNAQNKGKNTAGIVIGCLLAIAIVVIVAIVIYHWLKPDNYALDSDYLSVSNDYMMKDALTP